MYTNKFYFSSQILPPHPETFYNDRIVGRVTKYKQKHVSDIAKYIQFYQENPRFLTNATSQQPLAWFPEIVREYLGISVELEKLNAKIGKPGQNLVLTSTSLDEVAMCFDQFLLPMLLFFDSGDSTEILPIARFADNNLQLFGTWTDITLSRESLEQWFFESISNKYFWQDVFGHYGYPPITSKSKEHLLGLILQAKSRGKRS